MAGVARDQAERVLNLIALLTENSQPLTFTQIRGALGANNYADGESGRATFERDKALVRDMGVPIEMKTLGGNQAGESSYGPTITSNYYLAFGTGFNRLNQP